MKNKDKYRIAVSFMLLILYLFIAIPSCLWHKHDINIVKYSLKKWDSESSIFNTISNEDNCAVCSHEYAEYLNDFIAPKIIINEYIVLPIINDSSIGADFIPSQIKNKGPPYLIA